MKERKNNQNKKNNENFLFLSKRKGVKRERKREKVWDFTLISSICLLKFYNFTNLSFFFSPTHSKQNRVSFVSLSWSSKKVRLREKRRKKGGKMKQKRSVMRERKRRKIFERWRKKNLTVILRTVQKSVCSSKKKSEFLPFHSVRKRKLN